MATVRKRSWKSGGETKTAWVADYLDAKGDRRQKTFHRRKDADAWLLETRADVVAGRHLPESTSPTVALAARRWIDDAQARNLERGTLQTYRQHVHHIMPLLGDMKVARLTLDQVKATRDTLLRTLSRPLAAKVMVSLRSILRQAGRPFDVRLDQASDRHSERLEVGKGIPTPEQVRALLAGANQPAKAIFALAALAGLRASEIRGLAWADIKLQAAGEVTVRQRADKWGDIGPPKTGDSRRKIPIGPQLMAILEDLGPGDGLVFPTRRGTPQNLGRLRRDVIGPTRLHSLRHFYASWALSQGVPLAILQRRMGHSTITLTADHYGHLIEPDKEERARLVAAEAKLFGG